MYGYLKLTNQNVPAEIRQYYRKEYCTLCHALWNYYGMLPRFLLSYDMTFVAVLLDLIPQITFQEKLPICYFRRDILSNELEWKHLAAMSILLASEKLRDDISDENSIKAKIALVIFSKPVIKAERDYPELSAFLRKGFQKMSKIEKQKGSVDELADSFSDIMVGAFKLMFKRDIVAEAILRHVSRWVYFIDAIDDLDNDIKEACYNPFESISKSRKMLVENNLNVIQNFVVQEMTELKPVMQSFEINTYRNRAIINVLNDSIPLTTINILLGKRGSEQFSLRRKVIESKGGFIFA